MLKHLFEKILFFSIFILILNIQNSFSQEKTFGIRGYANLASFVGRDIDSELSNKFGLGLNLYVDIPVDYVISVQTELGFSQKGAIFTKQVTRNGILSVDASLSYITLPILFKVQNNSIISAYILGGPEFGYLITTNVQKKAVVNTVEVIPEQYYPYTFSKFDLNLVVGGAIMYRGIYVEARYNLGVRSVYEGNNNPDTRNKVISFAIGYRMDFRKKRRKRR